MEIYLHSVAASFAEALCKKPLPAWVEIPRPLLSSGGALPQMSFRRMQLVWIELFGDVCPLGGELAHPNSGARVSRVIGKLDTTAKRYGWQVGFSRDDCLAGIPKVICDG